MMWTAPWVAAIIAQESRLRNLSRRKARRAGRGPTGSILAVRAWLCILMLAQGSGARWHSRRYGGCLIEQSDRGHTTQMSMEQAKGILSVTSASSAEPSKDAFAA